MIHGVEGQQEAVYSHPSYFTPPKEPGEKRLQSPQLLALSSDPFRVFLSKWERLVNFAWELSYVFH